MQNRITLLLLLVLSFFPFSIARAEIFEMKDAGLTFEIPEHFSRMDKNFHYAQLDKAISWIGPMKGPTGAGRWEFKIVAKKLIILDGWSASQQFEQEFNTTKANKFFYDSVEPINIQGALGAYFAKEVTGAKTFNLAWHAVAYSYDYRFEWIFTAYPSTFDEYNMVIQQILNSAQITAAPQQPETKDEFIRDF
jgi:hypothetical protein